MKIDETLNRSVSDVSQSRPAKKVDGPCFSDIFGKAVEKTEQTSFGQELNGPVSVPLTDPVSATALDTRLNGMVRGEELITLFDQYCTALADPKRTLKDVGLMLDSVSEKAKQLDPIIQSLPSDDPLRKILNEANIAVAVETIKFNRGDYL